MIKKVLVALVITVAVIVGAFLSIGGMQMVRLLVQGPKLPPSATSPSVASDLAYLQQTVLDNEGGAAPSAIKEFKAIVDGAPTPQSTDDLSLVGAEAEARLANAHSLVLSPRMNRLPVRVHWLSDGLVIVKADQAHVAILGRQITSIGGRTPEQLVAEMSKLVGGGTPGWVRYRSEYFLTTPSALRALGAEAQDGSVKLELVDPDGKTDSVTLTADSEPSPSDAFREWRHALPGDTHYGTEKWVTLLSPTQTLPLYQQEVDKLLWLKDVPESEVLYVRINGASNSKTETVAAFTRRILSVLKSNPRRNLILDLRYDCGGDYTLFVDFINNVPKAVPANGHIYLITGPNTFSAGLITASQIKYQAGSRLTIVGDDVGDTLRFRSEGFVIELPATKIEIYVPSAWDDVGKGCGTFDDCWPPNKFYLKGIGTLHPEIRIANDWAAYREGRDLLMDAIVADISKRSGAAPAP